MVIDSTDRERLSITKEELYKMLAHEVSIYHVFSSFFKFLEVDTFQNKKEKFFIMIQISETYYFSFITCNLNHYLKMGIKK